MDSHWKKLPLEFYQREDVTQIAQDLLGKKLCTNIHGAFTAGKIVETEAYHAPEDAASHAYLNRKTKRTMPFYQSGGIAYVYLIYGVYKLFNIITHIEGVPHAVLIRAIEPIDGIDIMLYRRNLNKIQRNLTGGPGLTSMALGIDMTHNGISMTSDVIWIGDAPKVDEHEVIASPRVGLGKNVIEPYYSIPWRFRLKNNPFTSPAK
ncbi:DNA-3-methyladenine glycosylase [Flavobacteriaceae bacterium Ap0902]|nr:DNA-3-methyladenine glycosylase [Flavobacteriaceae bacterium Ap0902]